MDSTLVCVCSLFHGVTWAKTLICDVKKSPDRNARFWLVETNFAALWLVIPSCSHHDYLFFVWQPFWSINWLKYTVCAVLLKYSDSKEMASSLFAGRLLLFSVVCAHLSSIRSFLSPEPLGLVTTNRWQHKHNDGQSSNKHDHAGVSLNPSRRVNIQFP